MKEQYQVLKHLISQEEPALVLLFDESLEGEIVEYLGGQVAQLQAMFLKKVIQETPLMVEEPFPKIPFYEKNEGVQQEYLVLLLEKAG